MKDYQKYINALRKCAKEHENDRTSTGHIIVSDLCKDTANLLEELEQEPRWIPISERLPEDLEPVNITWVNHNPESYYADIKDKPFTATYEKTKRNDEIDIHDEYEITEAIVNGEVVKGE